MFEILQAPLMDVVEHVHLKSWIGLEVHRMDILSVVLLSNKVCCSNPRSISVMENWGRIHWRDNSRCLFWRYRCYYE